jgi:UDP-glucose 4-epimerase
MRILVTGALGFVGTNLIKKLVDDKHIVVGIDDLSIGSINNKIDGCSYYIADINYLDNVFKNYELDHKFDLCFHLSALSRIQPSFTNPIDTFKSNTETCLTIAEWARKVGAKVIYSGSSSRWHDPFRSPYACFKHLGEEIFKLYKKVYGLDVEIVRFYNVYGPGEIVNGDWAAVIGKWRGQIERDEPITIVGDGEQRRDFTHIDDIIDALIKIAFSNQKHEDAWELGTGNNYSINEVYEMFREKFGVEKINLPEQKGNYRVTKRENDDTLNKLGWTPKDRLKNYIQSL